MLHLFIFVMTKTIKKNTLRYGNLFTCYVNQTDYNRLRIRYQTTSRLKSYS
jgi:hypothetical protein